MSKVVWIVERLWDGIWEADPTEYVCSDQRDAEQRAAECKETTRTADYRASAYVRREPKKKARRA